MKGFKRKDNTKSRVLGIILLILNFNYKNENFD